MGFDFSKIGRAIGSFAPTLATMLGGPFAGAAVAALEGAFGLESGAGGDAITKVMQTGNMTPEIMASIRAADQKHEELLRQQGIDLVKINADHEALMEQTAAGDRKSARDMQVAKPSLWPGILAAVTTGAVIGVITLSICGLKMPQDPTTVQLIGSLTTGWGTAMAYWLGTTRNSGDKDARLAQAQNVLVDAATGR